jgi:Asp-tRNA(Asn)/Glu-tRNA(Gln) amidotransferase A subunit family amidase
MARTVGDCIAMLEHLVLGFAPAEPPDLREVRVGLAGLEYAHPLVHDRVQAAAARFGRAEAADLTEPTGTYRLFLYEVARVHEGLFPGQEDSYGEDVREKLVDCFKVTEREADEAARERERYRERCLELIEPFDLLLTPTLTLVAPPVGRIGNDERGLLTRLTYPINVLGWPALALPCGTAEDRLPASVQLIGRPGDDALVLAAGLSLERGTPAPS